jgi:hypothetical protein
VSFPMSHIEQRRSWMARNWKWMVPLLAGVVLFIAFAGGIALFVFHIMKSSVVYQQAVARATEHPAVVDALGTPIKADWWVAGEINTSAGTGSAKLTIPLAGPRGSAQIYLTATKSGNDWTFTRLAVQLDAETRIDLLAPR